MHICMDAFMITCFVDNRLTLDFALMIKCSHVYLNDHILLCSHTLMFTCFDDCMLPCLYALMITYHLPVYCHSHMIGCFNDYMLIYCRSHMIGHFYDYLLVCSNALMIECSHVSIFT